MPYHGSTDPLDTVNAAATDVNADPNRNYGGSPTSDRFVFGRDDLLALQAETGASLRDLSVLQRDPFLTGTDGHLVMGEWAVEQAEALGMIGTTYQRDFHYALVSHLICRPDGKRYAGDDSDEDFLSVAVSYARELGLLPRDAFADQKGTVITDETHRRNALEPFMELFAPSAVVPALIDAWVGSWSYAIHRPSDLNFQPLVVEVFTEKDGGFVNILKPICEEFGCSLTVARGFTGKSVAYEILGRAIADGRPRIVLTLSDADAAGESMPNTTGRHLEHAIRQAEAAGDDVPRIMLLPVGLTLAQVDEIEREIGKPIPRAPDVGREQGRVELNALPFFAPGWLEREFRHILDLIWADVDEAPVDEYEAELDARLVERFGPILGEIEQVVVEANKLLGTPEATELAQKLANYKVRVDSLRADADAVIADLEDDVTPPDVKEVDLDVLGIDWLLDSNRGYIEQLNAYRKHEPEHRRRGRLVLTARPGCEECGADMTLKKTTARFCSDEHRSAFNNRKNRGQA